MNTPHTEATIKLEMEYDIHGDYQHVTLGSTEIQLHHETDKDLRPFADQEHHYQVVHDIGQAYPNYGGKHRTFTDALADVVGRDAVVSVE